MIDRGQSATLVRSRDYRVFGITRHAEFRNVETFFFHFRRNAHAFHFVHGPEDKIGCTESPDRIQSCTHKLAQELPRITMEQTCYALACVAQIRRSSHTVPSRAISAVGKDADANGAEPSAVPMDRNRATG